jgi:hypothetical protein
MKASNENCRCAPGVEVSRRRCPSNKKRILKKKAKSQSRNFEVSKIEQYFAEPDL